MSSEIITNRSSEAGVKRRLSHRSRLHSLTGIQFTATGSYVPGVVVTNEDLSKQGYDPDWIIQRTGIRERRKLPAHLATSDMAYIAANRCLQSSGVDPEAVDLVLVATMTPDAPVPSTACLLQDRLGLTASAMDINAACAGFMYALSTAAQFVKTGCARHALVVGADTNTRIVNPKDPKTFPLFGDGAGAVLLGPGNSKQGLVAYTLGAEGEGSDMLGVLGGGSRQPLTAESIDQGCQYIVMDGRSVFKWAVRLLADAVNDVLHHADLTLDDIKLVVLHQANLRIMDAAAEDLGIERERLVVNLDRYGNTSAGSIPLGIDEAHAAGRLQRGDRILTCGFGAGLAWGAAIIEW